MTVERFLTASAAATVIFCDANFLFDLAVFASPALSKGVSPAERARANDAASFYHRYRRAKTTFISSPFTLEEIAHVLARRALKGTGVDSWKALRNRPADFSRARSAALSIIQELWNQLANYDVVFVVPKTLAGDALTSDVHKEVAKAALDFHRVYDRIDLMDAFHIACSLTCGAKWVATSDGGYKSVTEIDVFSGV